MAASIGILFLVIGLSYCLRSKKRDMPLFHLLRFQLMIEGVAESTNELKRREFNETDVAQSNKISSTQTS